MNELDPRAKLMWMLLCTTAALYFSRPFWMLGLALFSVIGAVSLGADLTGLVERVRRFFPLLVTVALIQVLFIRTGAPILIVRDHILATSEGLVRGLNIAVRLFVICCAASVMAGENNRKVIAALSKMGISYHFAFMLLTALRFLPFFRSAFSDAIIAIQLRGINLKRIPINKKLRLYSALILPVVAEAVLKAQDLAVAMEARGFGALPRRTSYLQVKMKGLDWVAIMVFAALGGIAFRLYISV